jgi:hypothetical protein
MTANIQRIDSFSSVENVAYQKNLSKDPMSMQMIELREADPKGYLTNIKEMGKMSGEPKSCPNLELLGADEMLQKKTELLKDQEKKHGDSDAASHSKKMAEDDGGWKDGKNPLLKDFNLKDLEIKIKGDDNLKKDSLPNYTIIERET